MDIKYQKTYEQPGNLFYSIAASVDHMKTKEVVKLNEIDDGDWLPLEKSQDQFCIDTAHFIYITFDYLLASLKSTVDASSGQIADAFGRANKSEFSFLARLNLLSQ